VRRKRGKGRVKVDKGMYDGYLHYTKHVVDDELPEKFKLDRSTYGKVIWTIHNELKDSMLYDAGTFKMPAGLPAIRVKKYKRKVRFNDDGTIDANSLAPNWPVTLKLWEENPKAKEQKKLIYFLNDHTDGHSAMVWMDKSRSHLANLSPYQFRPTRHIDRELAKILLDPYNKIDYYS
jgi:hypothetical protein